MDAGKSGDSECKFHCRFYISTVRKEEKEVTLATQMATDLSVFFNTDDFAVSATFTHGATVTTVKGLFDKDRDVIFDGYESKAITFEGKTSDLAAITKKTDTLVVSGTTYKINDYFLSPDSLTTTCILGID